MKRKILIPLLAFAMILAYSTPALNPALNSYADTNIGTIGIGISIETCERIKGSFFHDLSATVIGGISMGSMFSNMNYKVAIYPEGDTDNKLTIDPTVTKDSNDKVTIAFDTYGYSYEFNDGIYVIQLSYSVGPMSAIPLSYSVKRSISHNWRYTSTKASTCGEDGANYYTCTVCSRSRSDAIPATGNHNWELTGTDPASCGSDGAEHYTCSVCNHTKSETVPATGDHSWDSGRVTKKATCVASGVRTYTCTECDKTKTSSIPATGKHTWDSGKVTKPARYFSTGIRTYHCTGCSASKTATIPKKDVTKVTPAKVTFKSARVSNRNLTVKWKRIAKNTKGYQVSLKNKNTGAVKNYTVRQSSKSVLSKTIKKLKKGKTYAVRIRAYNKIGDETIYGKWSKVLSGKVR